MKSIEKNSLYNLMYTVLDMIIPILLSAYVARILLAEGVGRVAYAQNIVNYFGAFAEFGLTIYGTREIAKAREEHTNVSKIFTELFLINIMTTTCALAAYLFFIILNFGIKEQTMLFLVCGVSLVFHYLNIDWLYQGMEEYGYIVIRSLIVKIFSLVLIFLFVRTSKDYVRYAFIISLTIGGNCIVNIFRARKYVRLTRVGLSFRMHVKSLIFLALGLFLATVHCEISTTMLGIFSTNAETGCYSYALTAIEMITNTCTAVAAVFFPRLSFYYKNDRIKFYMLLDLGMRVLIFISIPVAAGVFIISPQIVQILFGNTFAPVVTMMRILSMLILIWSFSGVLGYQILIATGNERMRIPAYFVAIMGTVTLNYILIPILSGNGAAVAFVTGEFIVNSYLVCKLRHLISFSIPYKALGQALVSTVMMGIVVNTVIRIVDMVFAQCIFGVLGGSLVYIAVNLLLKNELLSAAINKIRKKGTFRIR